MGNVTQQEDVINHSWRRKLQVTSQTHVTAISGHNGHNFGNVIVEHSYVTVIL